MRWVLVAVICSVVALFFFVFVYFPSALNEYPGLKPYVLKVQNFLGLQVYDPFAEERLLEQADKYLQSETKREKYREARGAQPSNPWAGNAVPSEEDIDKYLALKKGWELCIQQQEMKNLKAGIKERIKPADPGEQLTEYVE